MMVNEMEEEKSIVGHHKQPSGNTKHIELSPISTRPYHEASNISPHMQPSSDKMFGTQERFKDQVPQYKKAV